MGVETIQIKAEEDGCIYAYNFETKEWTKICKLKTSKELPDSIRRKAEEIQRSTAKN
jgi:hypothetical protein